MKKTNVNRRTAAGNRPAVQTARVGAGLGLPVPRVSRFRGVVMTCAVLLGTLAAGAGCGSRPQPVGGDLFDRDDRVRSVDKVAARQAAIGARDDAILHERHFEADRLNPLGQNKVYLMLNGLRDDQRLAVFIDVPPDSPDFEGRRRSVSEFVSQYGIAPSLVSIEAGTNPRATMPATAGLRGLEAMSEEGPSESRGAGDGSVGGSGASSGAPPAR